MEYSEKDVDLACQLLSCLKQLSICYSIDEDRVSEIFTTLPEHLSTSISKVDIEVVEHLELLNKLISYSNYLRENNVDLVVDFEVVYSIISEITENVDRRDNEDKAIMLLLNFVESVSYIGAVNITNKDNLTKVYVENVILKLMSLMQKLNLKYYELLVKNNNKTLGK